MNFGRLMSLGVLRSCWTRISGWPNNRVNCANAVAFGWIRERQGLPALCLEAVVKNLGAAVTRLGAAVGSLGAVATSQGAAARFLGAAATSLGAAVRIVGAAARSRCNTGRFTLGSNQQKPWINSRLIKKKMNKASLRMCTRIDTPKRHKATIPFCVPDR